MKKIILTLAITIIAATMVFGQSKDEQEIGKMMDASAAALLKNDVAALSNIFADDLTFTVADGNVYNKTQVLDFSKNTKRESFNFDDLKIRTFGNTAVVNFTRTSTGISGDGEKMNSKSRDTAMLVKNGGRWQIVALQISNEMAADNQAAESQIGKILTDWGNALGRRDAGAVEKILPANFMLVSPDGKLYTNRAEYLEVVKNFPGEATIVGKGEKTIVAGDTAVQTGTYSVTPKAGGNTINYSYTTTFVRRDGRWMPIAFNSRTMTK